jgi:hypothetical protein
VKNDRSEPAVEGERAIELFADDGESVADVAAAEPAIRLEVSSDQSSIRVRVHAIAEPKIKLPTGEPRSVIPD